MVTVKKINKNITSLAEAKITSTVKPQNNGPMDHSNTVIGTLAVDG